MAEELSASPLDERRGFIRIPFRAETVVQADGKPIRSIDGIDVSMSGLRMDTEDPVPAEGASCEAEIVLASGEAEERVVIGAKGTVVRSRPGALAVRFTELDLDSYWHLRRLILMNADDPEKAEAEFVSHWGIRPAR